MHGADTRYEGLPIERGRDQFLRELVRELAGVIEDTAGLDEAEGFIATVGGRMGSMMNDEYRRHIGERTLDRDQVAGVLVDLKRRIEGGFRIESIDEERIVLVNDRCPFGKYVIGRESLCMMTSNVFGRIVADNLGHARISIDEAIAKGDLHCRVVIDLSGHGEGREYFG